MRSDAKNIMQQSRGVQPLRGFREKLEHEKTPTFLPGFVQVLAELDSVFCAVNNWENQVVRPTLCVMVGHFASECLALCLALEYHDLRCGVGLFIGLDDQYFQSATPTDHDGDCFYSNHVFYLSSSCPHYTEGV
jgi:hypothetical protein